MTDLTDIEVTRLCAAAVGLGHLRTDYESGDFMNDDSNVLLCPVCQEYAISYDPLHDDAQAMALVKKLGLMISKSPGITINDPWIVAVMHDRTLSPGQLIMSVVNNDLLRAICLCAAQVQQAKIKAAFEAAQAVDIKARL